MSTAVYLDQIRQLVELQKIDDAIFAVRQDLERAPRELEDLQQRFDASNAQRERVLEKLNHLQEQQKRLDFEIEALATGLQIHMEALDGNILPSGSFDVTFYYYILDEIEGIGSMELAIPVVIEDVEFDNTDTQYSAVNVKVPIQWSDYLGNEDIIFDEPFIAYATYTANDGASYDVPIYTFDVSFLG